MTASSAFRLLVLCVGLCCGGLSVGAWADETPESRPVFQTGSVRIEREGQAPLSYHVELARTNEQQAYGLMFKRALPRGQGMLFLFDTPREEAFWMKHTFIPLDILFLHDDGRIVKLVANAEPEDLTPILSEVPVSAVLEIGGGEAKAQGIVPGDKVVLQKP